MCPEVHAYELIVLHGWWVFNPIHRRELISQASCCSTVMTGCMWKRARGGDSAWFNQSSKYMCRHIRQRLSNCTIVLWSFVNTLDDVANPKQEACDLLHLLVDHELDIFANWHVHSHVAVSIAFVDWYCPIMNLDGRYHRTDCSASIQDCRMTRRWLRANELVTGRWSHDFIKKKDSWRNSWLVCCLSYSIAPFAKNLSINNCMSSFSNRVSDPMFVHVRGAWDSHFRWTPPAALCLTYQICQASPYSDDFIVGSKGQIQKFAGPWTQPTSFASLAYALMSLSSRWVVLLERLRVMKGLVVLRWLFRGYSRTQKLVHIVFLLRS